MRRKPLSQFTPEEKALWTRGVNAGIWIGLMIVTAFGVVGAIGYLVGKAL